MAFSLRHHKSVSKDIKRIIRRLMDDALAALASEKCDVVHDVRVHFKKVRACLRLVRGGLGDKRYKCENSCFRDAAKLLVKVRDAESLIETLDRLAGRFPGRLAAEDFSAIRKTLQERHQAMCEQVLVDELAFAVITRIVKDARDRLKDWPMKRKGWTALHDGLRRGYRGNRRAMAQAQRLPTSESFHEWRKQAKYLWYQLLVLETLWPAGVKAWDKAFHKLTQALGNDHDLAALRLTLTTDSGTFGKITDTLAPLIDRRRGELQKQAFALGSRLYRDKPGAFLHRIEKHWERQRKNK